METVRFFRFFLYLNWNTVSKTFCRAFQRRLVGLSAEIAYNAMLALFPTILAILTALGLFEESLQSTFSDLANQYRDVIPGMVWELLHDFVTEIAQTKSKSLFSLSFIVAIWVSSSALSTAMNALDQIHHIPRKQRRPFWRAKLISLFITVGTIVLLVVASFIVLLGDLLVKLAIDLIVKLPVNQTGISLLLKLWNLLSWPIALGIVAMTVAFIYQISQSPTDKKHPFRKAKLILLVFVIGTVLLLFITALLIFIDYLIGRLEFDYSVASVMVNVWQFVSWPVSLAIVSIAFAFIYRIGPSRWVHGTPVLPGAILAALSWASVSALFRLYVLNFGQYNKVYGAVGAVIVLMLWLQMTALVMLLGEQLNATVGEAMQEDEQKILAND